MMAKATPRSSHDHMSHELDETCGLEAGPGLECREENELENYQTVELKLAPPVAPGKTLAKKLLCFVISGL